MHFEVEQNVPKRFRVDFYMRQVVRLPIHPYSHRITATADEQYAFDRRGRESDCLIMLNHIVFFRPASLSMLHGRTCAGVRIAARSKSANVCDDRLPNRSELYLVSGD